MAQAIKPTRYLPTSWARHVTTSFITPRCEEVLLTVETSRHQPLFRELHRIQADATDLVALFLHRDVKPILLNAGALEWLGLIPGGGRQFLYVKRGRLSPLQYRPDVPRPAKLPRNLLRSLRQFTTTTRSKF